MEKLHNWVPAIFVMSIIFLMSSATGQVIDDAGLNNNTIQISGHAILFSALCIAFYKATKDIYASIVLSIFYGVLDEIHQIFTVARNPSLFDVKVDTISILFAALILWKLQHLLPKKLENWLNN